MPAVPVDETELYERARAAVAEGSPGSRLGPITRLQGGSSSITYWATLSGGPVPKVVLKVAPAGLEPTKNRDVLRQAKIQTLLQGTGVPAPVVIAEARGSSLERPPFYVMAFDEGDCVEPSVLPEGEELPPEEVRARELEAARFGGRAPLASIPMRSPGRRAGGDPGAGARPLGIVDGALRRGRHRGPRAHP